MLPTDASTADAALQNVMPFPEEKHTDLTTESADQYGLGMLCPVHLGDQLKEGRYCVLRKLGYGVYSTVWLAADQR